MKQSILKSLLSWIFFFLGVVLCFLSIQAFNNWNNIPVVNDNTTLTKDLWNTTMNTLTWNIQQLKDSMISKTWEETIGWVKTFSSFPVTPSSQPTTDYQVANKKYVDDKINWWPSWNYCILRSWWSCPTWFTSIWWHIAAFQGYTSNNNGSYYSNSYIWDSYFWAHWGSGFPYWWLADIVLRACCK